MQTISPGARPSSASRRPEPLPARTAESPQSDPRGSVREARRIIVQHLGTEVIRALHRPRPLRDALTFCALCGAFIGLALALGTLPLGALWLACLVLQGFVIQAFGIYAHDACQHRAVGGERLNPWLNLLCQLPLPVPPSLLKALHLQHHRAMGTSADTEIFKEDLDRRWVKLANLTLPGFLLVARRALRRDRRLQPLPTLDLKRIPDGRLRRRIRQERAILGVWALLGILGALYAPRVWGLGYLLPLFATLPLAVNLRLILEHADVEPGDPFRHTSLYRCGPLTRPLMLWSSGDSHLVHHIFPALPHYNMGEALALIRPVLESHGAVEERSLAALLWQWFAENCAHGTDWRRSRETGEAQGA